MSKRNILASLAIASALFAAPAFADGKITRTVKGPTPLKAQPYCASGKGYYDDSGRFICPVITRTPARTYTPAPARTYTPAPVRVAAPAPAPKFDLSGMTGGVGSTVGSGFYGGGGGIVLSSARAPFSGVLSAPAAALTFNRRRVHRPAPPMPMPMPGCGCGGGD